MHFIITGKLEKSGNQKVLIITYYWPPSGGSPVLRWLNFAKNLPDYGWEPVIYTPENPSPQEYDDDLRNEIPPGIIVLKTKIWEPYSFYNLLLGQKRKDSIPTAFLSGEKGKSLLKRLGNFIRSNWFIPDARKFWINPSIKNLSLWLQDNPVDLLLTSGPPHSMHIIGLGLKKKYNLPWIADFRDPWTKIDYYKELLLTKKANKKHHTLEMKVLTSADAVITVSPTMSKEFLHMGAKKVYTLTNGFAAQYMQEDKFNYQKFSLMHVGSIAASRNAEILWEVLRKLVNEDKEFEKYLEIQLIGKTDHTVTQSLEKNNLTNYVKHTGFIPNSQVVEKASEAAILLLLINNTHNAKGILTNKFFDYLAARRPILAIGPVDGDAAEIIKETQAGEICDFHDSNTLTAILKKYFTYFIEKKLMVKSLNVEKYSRKNITETLVDIFHSTIID